MGDSGIMFSNFLDPIAKVWGNNLPSGPAMTTSSKSKKKSYQKKKKLTCINRTAKHKD